MAIDLTKSLANVAAADGTQIEPEPAAPKHRQARKTAAPHNAKQAGARVHQGKSSNDEFTSTLIYIRKKTKQEATIGLIRAGGQQDFSDLVESLLKEWISKHPAS